MKLYSYIAYLLNVPKTVQVFWAVFSMVPIAFNVNVSVVSWAVVVFDHCKVFQVSGANVVAHR